MRSAGVRAFALVDAENLDAEHRPGRLSAGLGDSWRALVGTSSRLLAVAGSDARRAFDLAREFPGYRHVVGHGPDGADLALIDAIDWTVLERFDCLVIGSGDHAFALPARRARRLGLTVIVVARPEALSRDLRQSVDHILDFSHTRVASEAFVTAA